MKPPVLPPRGSALARPRMRRDRSRCPALPTALAAGLALTACGAEPSALARDQGTGRDPVELPAAPGASIAPDAGAMAHKYELRDAARDGWTTEVFHQAAKKQLRALVERLRRPEELGLPTLADLVSDEVVTDVLRPPLDEAFSGRDVTVLRPVEGAEHSPGTGVEAFAARLAESAAPFSDPAGVRRDLHVVGVESDGTRAVTTAVLHASGATAEGLLQQNSTWRVHWTRDEAPLIRRVEQVEYEEVRGPADGSTLFAEATASVLGRNRSWGRQLVPSLSHWASRLDLALGMSLIGHEGLAVGDANGDGLDDLFLCQPGGLPNLLFLQQPDGTARDVSRDSGVDHLDPSRSALFADLDDDGDQDLAAILDHGPRSCSC